MDFFAHQDAARKASKRLTVLFVIAVIAVVLAVNAVVYVAAWVVDGRPSFNSTLFLSLTIFVLALIFGGTGFRMLQLSDGGSAVAELMGGRRISPATTELAERRLMNVVEEMALASGTPVPLVYVMDRESAINAFAAGYSTNDAAIAVTRGLLDSMTRDELQGVIGHEFSHILNGDMRLNIRMIGLLFGVEMVGLMGRIVCRIGAEADGRVALAMFAFGGAIYGVGSSGVLASNLIRAAVGRQREYLADASAVQFTRNPEGIGLALVKIARASGLVHNVHTAEVSHMFIAGALRSRLSGLLATHPPIDERITRVLGPRAKEQYALREPGDAGVERAAGQRGEQLAAQPMAMHAGAGPSAGPPAFGRHGKVAGGASQGGPVPSVSPASPNDPAAATVRVTPENVLAAVGNPGAEHVDYAKALRQALPREVLAAIESVQGAKALLVAMLAVDAKPEAGLGELLREAGEAELADLARGHADWFRDHHQHLRLPVVSLALPVLRVLPREDRARFLDLARRVVMADDRITPFEFALMALAGRALDDVARRTRPARFAHLKPLKDDVVLVLSLFVRLASEGSTLFDKVVAGLGFAGEKLLPPSRIRMQDVEAALARIAELAPLQKPRFIKACLEIVIADGQVNVREGEMMRALCATLDSPLPPIIDAQAWQALQAA